MGRGRRRKNARRPKISKAARRRAALLGVRRKKSRGGRKTTTRRRRRSNARGLFKTRRAKVYKRRGKAVRRRGRRTVYSRPVKRSTLKRRASSRRRRRNPNGFIGVLMKMDTWVNAGQIAVGAIGSGLAAGWAYNQFAPPVMQTENARMIGRPVSIAVAGALVGWGIHAAGFKKFGKQFAWGGIVAAALDIATQIGGRMGLMGDYVQLQGLGTQAQVEAGVFGMGTQAQVEAGVFGTGDYIQMDGLGQGEEEVSAAQTFGPTF